APAPAPLEDTADDSSFEIIESHPDAGDPDDNWVVVSKDEDANGKDGTSTGWFNWVFGKRK
ncbi:MAG TPA: hypothetical protein DEA62_03265, partial [Coxiellaceae bacterium]|nr:hypothetical protein [Coxiellaceae bacterium]